MVSNVVVFCVYDMFLREFEIALVLVASRLAEALKRNPSPPTPKLVPAVIDLDISLRLDFSLSSVKPSTVMTLSGAPCSVVTDLLSFRLIRYHFFSEAIVYAGLKVNRNGF